MAEVTKCTFVHVYRAHRRNSVNHVCMHIYIILYVSAHAIQASETGDIGLHVHVHMCHAREIMQRKIA